MPHAHWLLGGNWQGVSPFFEDDAENFPVAGIEAGEVAGASISVVAYWPGFWAARRASQLQVSWEFQDGEAPVEEPSTLAPWAVRLPFKRFGYTPFRFSETLDESFVEPEADTAPIWLARPQYLRLGRTPFRFTVVTDVPEVAAEFENTPWVFIRMPYRVYTALRAVSMLHTFTPLDEDAPAPPGGVGNYTMFHHHHHHRR